MKAISPSFTSELKAKEQATGLALLVPGVSWVQGSTERALDPFPEGLSQAERDAINEVYAAHDPAATLLDVPGFKAWLKANMTFTLRNKVHKVYPMFIHDLSEQNWADFEAGCLEVKVDVPLTAVQWAAFKNAVATYKIPVTLT